MKALLTAVWHRVAHFLFPPVCPGCGTRHDVFQTPNPPLFCPRCRRAWLAARESPCPTCRLASALCRCMPRSLQRAGCRELLYLAPYDASDVAGKLILHCKQFRDRACFSFLSAELSDLFRRRFHLSGNLADRFVVTGVPRRRRTVRKYGHDQARVLAKSLAKENGLIYLPLLSRRRDGRAQKELSAKERRESAALAWRIAPDCQTALYGKTVLLLDDICTTGESLSACTRLLYAAGASNVIALVVGKSRRKTV